MVTMAIFYYQGTDSISSDL